MPSCYFLTVCAGSSVDQQTNNVTLFNLIEQITAPPGVPAPPRGLLPLEIHAYFSLRGQELGQGFEVRYVLVADSGLEHPSETFSHRSPTPHLRTRTAGLPFPPVAGSYVLRVDWRMGSEQGWRREPIAWPMLVVEAQPPPAVTH